MPLYCTYHLLHAPPITCSISPFISSHLQQHMYGVLLHYLHTSLSLYTISSSSSSSLHPSSHTYSLLLDHLHSTLLYPYICCSFFTKHTNSTPCYNCHNIATPPSHTVTMLLSHFHTQHTCPQCISTLLHPYSNPQLFSSTLPPSSIVI
jgi:hypothetical protein